MYLKMCVLARGHGIGGDFGVSPMSGMSGLAACLRFCSPKALRILLQINYLGVLKGVSMDFVLCESTR